VLKQFHRNSTFLLLGFFLVSSLLPGFGTEFKKLPSLVNHYQHHLEDHESVGFIEFLALHYDSESEHTKSESHEDLPLFQGAASVFYAIAHEPFNLRMVPPTNNKEALKVLPENLYAYAPVGALFQPPKQA
jgi:hypothetical protein